MSGAYACVVLAGDVLKRVKHPLPLVQEFIEERNLK